MRSAVTFYSVWAVSLLLAACDPDPMPVTGPFASASLDSAVSDLPSEEKSALCRIAWEWLLSERSPEYAHVFCLTQIALRSDVVSADACLVEFSNCLETFPPDRVVDETCRSAQERTGVCSDSLRTINSCFVEWSAEIAATAATNDCASIISEGLHSSLFPAPTACSVVVAPCRELVGFGGS